MPLVVSIPGGVVSRAFGFVRGPLVKASVRYKLFINSFKKRLLRIFYLLSTK